MPISILRRQSRVRAPEPPPAIGALSLPDLTEPLISPDEFSPRMGGGGLLGVNAAYAALSANGSGSNGNGGPVRRPGAAQPYPLPTSPSFSGSLSPPMSPLDPHSRRSSGGFFSPVSAWADPGTGGGREPSQLRDSNGNVVSFHRPFSSGLVAAPSRRGKARRQATLTAMVVGPSGAGKTSFIEALATVLDPGAIRPVLRAGTTTGVVRHELVDDSGRRAFTVLDTPGLPCSSNSSSSSTAKTAAAAADAFAALRERALTALVGIVETRLADQLSEENKVVRRKSDGAELVHLVIYLVDARTVLVKPATIDIDWDTIAEPPAKAPRPESRIEGTVDVEARFPVEDIEAIRRFSARANVLPVLTHADALTTDELRAARGAVVRDLATVFGRDPLGKWGVLSVMPADSDVEVEIDPDVSMEDDEEDEEGEGGETSLERPAKHTPFAVFAPEPGRSTRIFPWGRADAADAAHSDLPAIREALISAAQWLRTSTREGAYEKFRTEKLLSARVGRE